jgi:protein-tyrosine-phosphatase
MGDSHRVLFVCHGNIFRSAFSHYRLVKLLDDRPLNGVEVRSGGTIAKPGDGSEARVVKVAAEYGLDMAQHGSVRLSTELLKWATQIFVMEESMVGDVESLDLESGHKTRLLGSLANPKVGEIEDIGPNPDVEGAVRDRFRRLDRLISLLVDDLAGDHPAT